MVPCFTSHMHWRGSAARTRGWAQHGRDRSAVVDWRACRFVLIGIAPFAVSLSQKGAAGPPAFWRRLKSPYRSLFIIFSYYLHLLIPLLSFYFRGPLNTPGLFAFLSITHSLDPGYKIFLSFHVYTPSLTSSPAHTPPAVHLRFSASVSPPLSETSPSPLAASTEERRSQKGGRGGHAGS